MKTALLSSRFRRRARCWLVRLGWRLAGLALLAGALGPAPARAADDDNNDGPVRFHDVKGWRGTLVATARPSQMAQGIVVGALTAKGVKSNLDYSVYVNVEFVLTEYESDPSVWKGRVERADYSSGYRWTTEAKGAKTECVFNSEGPLDFSGDARVELQFHRERGWSVRMPSGRRATELREKWTSPEGKVFSSNFTGTAHGMGSTKTHPYPKQGFILFASGETKETTYVGVSGAMTATPAVDWDYTIYLEPTSMTELRLEFEDTAAYREWRPDAQLDGGPGTPLEIKATLVAADGGKPKTDVKSFVWELSGTSQEDGIAMNYPVNPPDVGFDLELDVTGPMSVLDNAKQRVTRAVRSGFSDTVKVVPRDWGGWATLQATAILADGRRVQGKLKGKKETGLRLPKRAADSKIADVWKQGKQSGADKSDDESEPVGDGNKGDGFTLYEEYRGFIVKGQHVEGDPKKKDFFVLNLIGADAEPGIGLFEALSGFRVHRVEPNEMSQIERRMNGNGGAGAHIEYQHGVVLAPGNSAAELAGKPADKFGAMTYSIDGADKAKAFRPGTTKIIGILPPGHAESLFSTPGNLSAADGSVTFYRAVAHELMHSVGVEEHGVGDGSITFVFVGPEHHKNSVGRPYYAIEGSAQTPVTLLDEQDHDLAATMYPRYAVERQQWVATMHGIYVGNPGDPGYPKLGQAFFDKYCDLAMESACGLTGQVGAEHGEHSGDQDCIMRYHFASFYPFAGRRDAFYMIAPGAEKIGFSLCRSPAGTGVNAPGHTPQSRHGAAAPGAGNCTAQICPNDAVPPRKSALPAQ